MHITHFLTNGEIQTAYNDLPGPMDEEPFVLVHGFTGSKLDFADHLPRFSEVTRVLAYDQRGHGESSNQGPYTEARFVADLIGFLDELGIRRCQLLGHSFGGMIAMKAVLDHPERFRSLILMDTAATPLDMFQGDTRKLVTDLVSERGCSALVPGMRAAPASTPAQRGIDFLGETEHWRRITTKLEQMDPQAFQDVSAFIEERDDLTESLRAVDLPVTVIVGEHDKPFLSSARAMAAAVEGAVLEVVPEAGHSPQFENAEHWHRVVLNHLTGDQQPRL